MSSELQNVYMQMIQESHYPSPELPPVGSNHGLEVKPYPGSRFFAIYEDGELLAVTVYKKGAVRLAERIRELKNGIHP